MVEVRKNLMRFKTGFPAEEGTLKVFVDGRELKEGEDFWVTNCEDGEFVIDLDRVGRGFKEVVVDFVLGGE